MGSEFTQVTQLIVYNSNTNQFMQVTQLWAYTSNMEFKRNNSTHSLKQWHNSVLTV